MAYRAVLCDVGGTLLVDGVRPADSIRRRLTSSGIDTQRLSLDRITSILMTFLENEREWRTEDHAQRDCVIWAR